MTYPLIFECQVCKQTFKTKNIRSFTGTTRRHRLKAHAGFKGKIKYSVIKPDNN